MIILKNIWEYGAKQPFQKIGIIILILGLFSMISWSIKANLDFLQAFDPYYFPRSHRDFLFFHLYLYFIPLGLTMSFGYRFLILIKNWVFKKEEINKSDNTKPNLIFKDSESAFDFGASIYPPSLNIGMVYFGIVRNVVLTLEERFQYTVELANQDSAIFVHGFNDKNSEFIKIDSLIYWRCEKPIIGINQYRIEATGMILALLEPKFNPNDMKWLVSKDLRS
ncbi:hypothetical protein [Acinetobacter gyllenbergii]|uniref:hypothetical protein n=1 Tax=Acinetobacter gyllenbergii TaxID=134534 RepID=UPI003AF7DA55